MGWLLGAGAIVVWALALYVASRSPTRRTSILAALAMLCLAAYLTGETLGALGPSVQDWAGWLRRTWWGTSVAPPLWLVLTLTFVADEGTPRMAALARRWLPVLAIATLGIGLTF